MTKSEPDVEHIEVRLILEAVKARYGYDLTEYAEAPMRRRLANALRRSGAETYAELQHRLLHEPEAFAALLEDLTVQVSDMFRDPEFYRALRNDVVPHLRPYPQIRVWHAGCAGGEEVYSTAIVLLEEGLLERTQVYATDLSARALQRAVDAVYPAKREEAFAENYASASGRSAFAEYHSTAYDQLALSDRLKHNVHFFPHNLVSDHVFGEMQLVLCRNVMIYFNGALRAKVLKKLEGALCHGGFLALGRGERLPPELLQRGFTEFCAEQRIYRYWGTS